MHIWACGADIASFGDAQAWLSELEAVHDVIPPNVIMFHLNDNRNACGSGVDEHDPLLRGAIWGDYLHLDYARRFGIPTILERKGQKNAVEPHLGTACGAIGADLSAIAGLSHF